MTGNAKYKTKQKAQILAFLESRQGEHLTAKGVQAGLEGQGAPMGTATIYRQLECLVSEGVVRKYSLGPSMGACFEYVGEDRCSHEHCFHCLCTGCGKLIHVQCDQLASIAGHLQSEHGFAMDPLRTVFYGMCADCAAQAQAQEQPQPHTPEPVTPAPPSRS